MALATKKNTIFLNSTTHTARVRYSVQNKFELSAIETPFLAEKIQIINFFGNI